MTDITITRSGELMVAGVRADTDEGVEFVDAWFPTRKDAKYTVVDSGQLVVQGDVDALVIEARTDGLNVNVVNGV